MPIIKNNLYYELTSETLTKPVSAVKIQMDVLDNCAHNCDGCYVNRRNNSPTDEDIKNFSKFVDSITGEGVLVDEILIGPTDFLSSSNLFEVLSDDHLINTINENSPILAFVTTFMGGKLDRFCEYLVNNINTDTEIEIGIATQPDLLWNIEYIVDIKDCLKTLSDSVPHDITYTFILNMDEYDIDYEKLHKHVVDTFDTTIDLIPSVARSKNKDKILTKIHNLNDFYNELPLDNEANNIMVDHSHSGVNFKVLNFKRGDWYLSPFLYENMAIYDDIFKIDSFLDVQDKILHQYATDTECVSCNFFNSCVARSIPLLMEFLEERNCICPKDNMTKNMHVYKQAASDMYDWDNYSVELDKEGYRKKFLVHDDNIENLERLEEIYNDRS